MLAKRLYIAKRIGPDILLPVLFLTTSVQQPTEEDNIRLQRVLKYLNGSKERSLKLSIGDNIFIEFYIDASYAVHD